MVEWDPGERLVLNARDEGEPDPGDSSGYLSFQRTVRARLKQGLGSAGRDGGVEVWAHRQPDSMTRFTGAPRAWQGQPQALQPCTKSGIPKVPPQGHLDGTLNFGLERTGV